MRNTTLRANRAAGASSVGGGAYITNGRTIVSGCDIAKNAALRAGGAFYIESNVAHADEGEPTMDIEAIEATGPIYPEWAVNQNPFLPAFSISPAYYALLRGGAAIEVRSGSRFRDNFGLSDATRGLVIFGSSRIDVSFDPSVLIDMASGQSDDQSQVDVTDANRVSLGRNAQWRCSPGSMVVNVSAGRSAEVMPQWFPTVDRNGLAVNEVAAGFGWVTNFMLQCATCTAGTAGTGAWECAPCAVDHVSLANASQCARCPQGAVTSDHKRCVTCPAGFIENSAARCERCPSDTVSADRIKCHRCSWGESPGTLQQTCVPASWLWIPYGIGGIVALIVGAAALLAVFSAARAVVRESRIHRAARARQWVLATQLLLEERSSSSLPLSSMHRVLNCAAQGVTCCNARQRGPFAPGRDWRSPMRIALDAGHRLGYRLCLDDLLNSNLRPVPRRFAAVFPGAPTTGVQLLSADALHDGAGLQVPAAAPMFATAGDSYGERVAASEAEWGSFVLHMMDLHRSDAAAANTSQQPAARGAAATRQRSARCWWNLVGSASRCTASLCRRDKTGGRSRSLALQCLTRALREDSVPAAVLWPVTGSCLDSAGAETWRLLLPPPSAAGSTKAHGEHLLAAGIRREQSALETARGAARSSWPNGESIAAHLAAQQYVTSRGGANVVHTLVEAHVADLVDPDACAACIRSALREGGRELRHAHDAKGRTPVSVVIASAKHRAVKRATLSVLFNKYAVARLDRPLYESVSSVIYAAENVTSGVACAIKLFRTRAHYEKEKSIRARLNGAASGGRTGGGAANGDARAQHALGWLDAVALDPPSDAIEALAALGGDHESEGCDEGDVEVEALLERYGGGALVMRPADFDLHTKLSSSTFGGRDIDECIAVLRTVAESVAMLHARGILHGDVKPRNVC